MSNIPGISESIIIGVVSGILTSFVVWLVVIAFKKAILPWYQSITYRGVRIHGSWVGFYEGKEKPSSEDDPDYSIILKQRGHDIEGILTRNRGSGGRRDTKNFIFNGLFRDGNLVLSYKPEDETRLGVGTYVLQLVEDGREFHGKSLYVTSNNGKVAEFEVIWKRKQ